MADADPAPAAPPEANPDDASDAELAARAAALVAALRSGDSDTQTKAAEEVKMLAAVAKGSETPEPALPRTVAALVAAGVGAALLPLIHQPNEVGVTAADTLCELMVVSDAERRAVVDNVGPDKLLQLLHESQDKLFLDVLAPILLQFTYCSQWVESLPPDCDLVSRIFSLPFLSTANALAIDRALRAAERLLKNHPSFRRALVPARTSLLVKHLELSGSHDEAAELVQTASRLLQMLQNQDDFDVVVFDEARVHVACVDLLGQLCRFSGRLDNECFAEPTRVLATSFVKSSALRKRIQHLIFACPGALAGIIAGIGHACETECADADALISFFDALRRLTTSSAESFLVDPQFATNGLIIYGALEGSSPACTQLRRTLRAAWKTPDCLRALTQPLKHQKLAVAVSLASLLDYGYAFRRIFATDDHIEVLAHALVASAGSPRLNKVLAGDFQSWQEDALRFSLEWFESRLGSDDAAAAAAGDAAAAAGPAVKRARTSRGTTLRASDVNVQRRDSTVLLIAGRPFYVFGALIETKSAVLADALSSATTLDPVAIALPNEVPEEQQYALFHAAVEHTYTGAVASDMAPESLLPLWCLGDHLQLDELCAWCAERLVPVLAKDAALLERAWTTALARPSDALGDACAAAWLLLETSLSELIDISAVLVLKRVHESCAAKELVPAQLARVMRKALLEKIAKDDAADD